MFTKILAGATLLNSFAYEICKLPFVQAQFALCIVFCRIVLSLSFVKLGYVFLGSFALVCLVCPFVC